MRALLRRLTTAALTGALTVGAAWAGTGLVPVSPADLADEATDRLPEPESTASEGEQESGEQLQGTSDGTVGLPSEPLSDGWYHAGAAKVDLYPRPDDYGGRWQRDPEQCETLDGENYEPESMDEQALAELASDIERTAGHVAVAGTPWPENPDCIYVGGYGIGPMNAVEDFDREYGLWVRTLALSDGSDPLFLTVIDAEGWFWDYAERTDFGWKVIAEELASELSTAADPVDRSAFIFHATHSHTAMDFIGGWGYVPEWYMQQARDAVVQSVRDAVASMRPAKLEIGEELARQHNRERRDTYHAPEEPALVWLRAYVPGEETTETTYEHGKSPQHTETTTTTGPAETIATVGVFAGHPTTVDVDHGIAHADWPGLFAAGVEERFGGVGMHFMSGLGNMSAAGGTMVGARLAELIPEVGAGQHFAETSVATTQATWNQPVTNAPLTALGAPGFFDRKFLAEPAAVHVSDGEARTGTDIRPEELEYHDSNSDRRPGHQDRPFSTVTDEAQEAACRSASATSVEVVANAARVGDLLYVTSGPGELFSNTTNTIKEHAAARGAFAMPIAQANDALGYLPESFEAATNPASGQGAGFATSGPLYIEYEDAYAIDRCFGDMNLETTLGLMRELTPQAR